MSLGLFFGYNFLEPYNLAILQTVAYRGIILFVADHNLKTGHSRTTFGRHPRKTLW